jgi:hypothetical protein
MDTGEIVALQKSGNFYFQILTIGNPKIHLVSIFFFLKFAGRKKATYTNMYMKVSRLAPRLVGH